MADDWADDWREDWREEERRRARRWSLIGYGGVASMLVLSWMISEKAGAPIEGVFTLLALVGAMAAVSAMHRPD
ncbi:MAG: hypothetical protein AAGJ87_03765 [Pseudomonadota bacterium]